ncbi:WD repeat-containing protein 78 [Blyttiomyces sp. JEL0837]|nr:WD repeat-containing protein 78 [Blyttiomyces sp. JEL0837]
MSSGGGETSGLPAKTSAFIARQAGGLCFDFNPRDSNIYLVGTEDGHIHKCSCSYNEQYLLTQFGHTGPVYKVKWSPFLPGTFISSSADWTVRLWVDDEEEASLKFQSGKDAITDIAWSPASSTMFGCVSNDGRMEIWDLQYSVLDPIILHTVLDRQLTSILFASKSPTVLIGDDNGAVNVYNLRYSNTSDSKKYSLSVPHGNPSDIETWKEKQASLLADIIRTKNQK